MSNWKEYFNFSRREFIGILSLCLIIMAISVAPIFFPDSPAPVIEFLSVKQNEEKLNKIISSANEEDDIEREPALQNKATRGLEKFDPNTASKAYWISIGLREKTAGTIVNYISRGGKFRKPEDLQRIYGLPAADYLRIKSYIEIKEGASVANKKEAESAMPYRAFEEKKTFQREAIKAVDINIADSAEFEALPGIGAKLSSRIVKFRDKLGGFYSVNQISELYGLADSVFQKIKPYLFCKEGSVKKIMINEFSEPDLSQHPYIGKKLSKVIVSFRDAHGRFADAEKLNEIHVLDSNAIRKLKPYLEF